jgi:hypothetical protein
MQADADFSIDAEFVADEFHDGAAAGAVRARSGFWPVFWTVFCALALPTVFALAHAKVVAWIGEIPTITIGAMGVAFAAGQSVIHLRHSPRIAQIVGGGTVIVFVTAMLAAGSPFADRLFQGLPQAAPSTTIQSFSRSLELAADYTTLGTLREQSAALTARLLALGFNLHSSGVRRVTGRTRTLRYALYRHQSGKEGRRVRDHARDWASQLRACRLAAPTTIRLVRYSLTCR